MKLKISKIFTQIRNTINQREDELLLEVDNKFKKLYVDVEFINKNKDLPNKIKKLIEKEKLVNKEWKNNNIKLNSIINDCLNIENKLDRYNEIYKIIKKNISIDIKILFLPDNKKKINEFLDKIKHFGDILNCQNNNKEILQDDFMNENNKVNQMNNQDNQINYQNQNNILINYKYSHN